jgi:phage-related protein
MATFPTLKTGAVAQYPLAIATRYQTQAVKFLDGSQQRYRIIGTGLRTWTIALKLLDDQELSALIAFVEQQGGAVFSFTDPLTGVAAPQCVISGDKFDATVSGEMMAQATLVIEEVA